VPDPPPPPPPPPEQPSDAKAERRAAEKKTWKLLAGAVGAVILLGVIINAMPKDSPSSGSDLDKRTCEIARDIAASYNVTDTIEESRQRLADLYSGYGEAASPAIAAGIRQWVSGLTSGDYKSAAQGVSATDAACAAEGF
jgi:hypothetical protein